MSKKYIVNEHDGIVVRIEEMPDYYDGCEDFMTDAQKALPREQYMIVRETDIVLGNYILQLKVLHGFQKMTSGMKKLARKLPILSMRGSVMNV